MRSLEDSCILKILTLFWDRTGKKKTVRKPEPKYRLLTHIEPIRLNTFMVDKIRGEVWKLPLPESLRNKIFNLIEPIGEEIASWRSSHISNNNLLKKKYSSHDLVWTTEWTIDKAKTAERIIKEKKEDLRSCYFLACINCLEDHIRKLWGELRAPEKCRMMDSKCALVAYWSYVMAEKSMEPLMNLYCNDAGFLSENRFGFRISTMMFNEVATQYFYKKCQADELAAEVFTSLIDMERMLDSRVCYKTWKFPYALVDDKMKVFCFLRSREKEERHTDDEEKYLSWPWVAHFMKISQINRHLMKKEGFNKILQALTSKYYTCNYLFEEFWDSIQLDLRQQLMFCVLDQQNLGLMFKNNKERGKNWVLLQVTSVKEPFSLGYRDLIKFVLSSCCSTMEEFMEIEKQLPDVNDKHELSKLMLESFFDKSYLSRKPEDYDGGYERPYSPICF